MSPEQDLYTVEEAAERLKLHPKTVRRHLREGRLKGARVGKQYRIARADLQAFAGAPLSQAGEKAVPRRSRHVEASSIVHIDAISPDEASRISNSLLGAAQGRDADDPPLRIDTLYDEERGRLKVIVSGSVATTAKLLGLVSLFFGE